MLRHQNSGKGKYLMMENMQLIDSLAHQISDEKKFRLK
jgi:hypothetical protein